MADSLVQKVLEQNPGLIQITGGRLSIDAAYLLAQPISAATPQQLEDNYLIGFLYRLLEAVSKAEDAWVPPAGGKKINSVAVVESTSLQQIAPGLRGTINQATLRVVQPVSMEQITAVQV